MKIDMALGYADLVHTLGYYEANDGGAADYIIREKTEDDIEDNGLIHILDNGLVAELIIRDSINIKQFGATGDGVTDDTEAIQNAINECTNIYIPKGIYKITREITINSNEHIFGEGQGSILVCYFDYTNSINYCFVSRDGSSAISRTIIENMKFASNNANVLNGGVNIEYSTRGFVFRNIWFEKISNPIYLGNKTYGIVSLENIFGTYFPTSLSSEHNLLSYGIHAKGNTVYGRNVEMIGKFNHGIYLDTAKCCSFKDINISGSDDYMMRNAIVIENSSNIKIDTGWFELLRDNDDGDHINTKSIYVIDSGEVEISNINLSSGSCFVDNSKSVKLKNIKYYTNSAGLRYLNNSEIECDTSSLGFANYGGRPEYIQGIVNITDKFNYSNSNIFNNPLILEGLPNPIAVTNSSLASKAVESSDFYTGNRSIAITTTNNQGAKLSLSGLKEGKTYTIMVYVKAIRNIDTIFFANEGISTDTESSNKSYKNIVDSKYHLIKLTFTVSSSSPAIKILAGLTDTTINGKFLVDSVFIFEGFHNFEISSPLTKAEIMKHSKIYASYTPSASSNYWAIGDTVYNDFSNSDYDSIYKWIYNGSAWQPKTIS